MRNYVRELMAGVFMTIAIVAAFMLACTMVAGGIGLMEVVYRYITK